MSRSNGPVTQPGAWPQQRSQTQEPDGQAWPAGQQGRWPTAEPMPPQAAYPQGAHPSNYPAYPAPQAAGASPSAAQAPAYHYPQGAEGHDPYSRSTLAGRDPRDVTGPPGSHGSGAHGHGYAPQFDPYAPPAPQSAQPVYYGGNPAPGYHPAQAPAAMPASAYGQPPAYAPPNGFSAGYAQAPAYAPPSNYAQELSSLQRAPVPEPAPALDLRGPQYDQVFDQWQQPAQYGQPDPRGYDLGGYMPPQTADAGRGPDLGRAQDYGRGLPSTGDAAYAGWGASEQPRAPAADQHFDIYGQPAYAPHGGGPHAGGAQGFGQPGAAGFEAALHEQQAVRGGQLEPTYQHPDDGAEYEIEEPKAGRRWALIAAALVGAIAVGGGMAYGYKTFLAPTGSGSAPIVKNDGGPVKVKPVDPGGKKFAHTDSKIMGRLNDGSGSAATSAATDSDGAARKVQTMIVRPDGSIQAAPPRADEASSPPAAAPAEPVRPTVSVPGMTIVDGFGGRPPSAALASAQPQPPAAARPVTINPPTATAPVAAAPAAAQPQAPARAAQPAAAAKPVVVARAAAVSDVPIVAEPKVKAPVPKKVAAAAAAPAAAAGTGANGFVVVLASVPASQKSSLDALKQFADIQQKYANALANKTPEVREANLGEKGLYHRLLVGPPGSREQAGQLCGELKAAGYGGCWVTAY